MALRVEVISEHKGLLGDDFECLFGPEGGTIGRSLKNDWVLPDRELLVSGRHATITFQAGSFYVADTSTNGVYVNGAIEPVGKGQPRRLFDGDRLRMGNFEMQVHLDDGDDARLPDEPDPTAVSGQIEKPAPDYEEPSIALQDGREFTGNGACKAAGSASGAGQLARSPVAEQQPGVDDTWSLLESGHFATFIRAAGIDPNDLHPAINPSDIMTCAGKLMRELVAGLSEMLVARANIKAMFRLDQTTVLPRHNNPLKLSSDTTDTLRQLLVGREGEYLGPLDSVREACRDLRYHQDAVIAGMTHAFEAYIERFDPDNLEEQFDESADRKSMFGSIARRKYWDMYCDLYPILTEKSTASLPQQFAEDFVRFYEKQLKDFKRREVTLSDTRRFGKSPQRKSRAGNGKSPRRAENAATDAVGFDGADTVTLDADKADDQRPTGH